MLKKEVITELEQYPLGYTISELSSKLKVSRHTVANVLAFLEGADRVSIRKVGMAKIYFLKNEVLS